MTAPIVHPEYRGLAERFAHPYDVRLLYPVRYQVRTPIAIVVKQTGITRGKIYAYERMLRMVPRALYDTLESYYIDECLRVGLINRTSYQDVKEQKAHRLHALSFKLRMRMSPTELLKWKRSIVQLSNTEIGAALGYARQTVEKAFADVGSLSVSRNIMKFLTKLERQTMETMNYDIYE